MKAISKKPTSLLVFFLVGIGCVAGPQNANSQNGETGDDPLSFMLSRNHLAEALTSKDLSAILRLKVTDYNHFKDANFPIREKMRMLEFVRQREAAPSTRWFYLESLKATAVFQTGSVPLHEGFAAYNALFDAADQAAAHDALLPLRLSIGEYTQLVAFRFRSLGLKDDPRTKATLLKAWHAYLQTADLPIQGFVPEPDFVRAFAATGADDEARVLLEKALADPKTARPYSLLSTAATLVAATEPERAIALLREAKAKLPTRPERENGQIAQKFDINEAARLYDRLVALLWAQGKEEDAIAAQIERVERVDGGRGSLWLWLKRAERDDAAAEIVGQLKKLGAREIEILRSARLWDEVRPDDALHDAAQAARIEVLENYIHAPRPREIELELEARVALARFYQSQGALEKLRLVLEIEKPENLSARGRYQWSQLENLKSQLPPQTQTPNGTVEE